MLVPDRTHKIEKAVSTDRGRPVLGRPYVQIVDGQAYLCATDSYQAVFLPVVLENGETAGEVPFAAIKASRQRGSDGRVDLQPDAAIVRGLPEFANGEARYARNEGKYPDVFAIRAKLAESPVIASIGLNAIILAKAQAALGADRSGVEIEIRGELKPVFVRPLPRSNEGRGIVMPIRIHN